MAHIAIYLLVIQGWSQYKLGGIEAASVSSVKKGMFISHLVVVYILYMELSRQG